LEEARQTDLLLHVADASNPAAYEQIATVFKVLEELGIEAKDTLLVLNKVDALQDRSRLEGLRDRYPNAIAISARKRQGLDQLALAVSDALSHSFVDVDVETGVGNGRLLAYLAAQGEVLSKHYNDSRVTVHCRLPQQTVGAIREEGTEIRPHRNGHAAAAAPGLSSPPVNRVEEVA
jgi:GTP-binding protein HflX